MEAVNVTRKIIENLFYIGLAALFGGLIYYNVNNVWDWKAQAAVYGGAAFVLAYLVYDFPALRSRLSSRTGRYGTTALTLAVLVIGILVLVNFLNFRHHKRVDLSASQLYGLSDQSQKVVGNLRGPIQIIGFYQESGEAGRFSELMKEYRYASSNVQTEVVDPHKAPGRVEQYNIQRNGQIVIASGPKTEIIDEATEEKITNAIIKVTREGEKTVYFLTGHGEKDINATGPEGFSAAREAMGRQNYQVRELNLAQENRVPEDASVIISAGPKVDFFPNEVELLEQYLADGGKLLILADPQTQFKMTDFLASYGVGLSGKVVLDVSGIGRFMNLGPVVPLVADYADHPITKDLSRVMSFFPRAQNVVQVSSSEGYQTSRLFSTSRQSWAESDLQGEEVTFDEGKDDPGPLDLGVAAIKSVTTPSSGTDGDQQESQEARLVVIGDSDFASNGYAGSASNLDVFLNSVSWLAEDADLIAVRPRSPENRTVNLSFQQSKLMFWGTVILLPLLTLMAGVGVWYKRR
jgi:ABC-type uncharacterized transport system involved in gliding motility auxiliary subunit